MAKIIKMKDSAAADSQGGEKDELDEQQQSIYQRTAFAVLRYVRDAYFYGMTPDGEPYVVPRAADARLPLMFTEKGGRLRADVTRGVVDATSQIPSAAGLDGGLRVAVAEAYAQGTVRPLSLRVATHDDGLVVDLGRRGSSRCVFIEPGHWSVLDHSPVGGPLFRRTSASMPLPDPVRGGSLDPLGELLGYGQDEPRWSLVRGWLVAQCFPDIVRPLLWILGTPGAAKSTRARHVASVLDPVGYLGGNFGKNLDDDKIRAASRYLVTYDNVSTVSRAVSDHLCRVVTGESYPKRKLYTDDDEVVITYRRTGICTSVALPGGLQADAQERIIAVTCDPVTEMSRTSEIGLDVRFAEIHPQVLGALFDAVAEVLVSLPKLRCETGIKRPRCSDFYDVLRAYDPVAAKAYVDALATQAVEAAEDDPFITELREWLATVGGSFSGSPTQVYDAATIHHNNPGWTRTDQWWPKRPNDFVSSLLMKTGQLRAVGIDFTRSKSNGCRIVTFRKIDQGSTTGSTGSTTGSTGSTTGSTTSAS